MRFNHDKMLSRTSTSKACPSNCSAEVPKRR